MKKPEKIEVLVTAEEITKRVQTIAKEIAGGMSSDIMIVSLLRGSFVFTADLIRALHFSGVNPQVDFMTLASYGSNTSSSGNVQIIRDIVEDVRGREILIVDDILESGRTLSFARDLIKERGASSIKIAVMLEKPGKRKVEIEADFVGIKIPDKFVVGYGLDYANYYRELPFIGAIVL
ncbi:MAG: hypoxanthine phosphoribosyltransferase [Pseudomonadota bacterium]